MFACSFTLIGELVYSLQQEIIKSKPRSELPEKRPNIYGRKKEIEGVVQALLGKSGENVLAGVLVSGPAGVGKSTVAIQAGNLLKIKFEAIVKYCSLRGTYKAGENEDDGVLREIFNVCVPGYQPVSEYLRYVLLNWCRQLENELILIVDNVEHSIEGRRPTYDLLNLLSDMRMCSDCKLKFLLTSKMEIETVGTDSNIQLHNIYLEALNVEESIKVLKNGARLTSKTDPENEVKLRKIAELCENNPLALRLAGPLLAEGSEYTFNELKRKLEQNPVRTLRIMPMMEIAFEKLDESLQRALVSLSVFPRSFKRDAAEAILGDNCAETLTILKERCLIQKQSGRYLIHLLIRSYAKQIGQDEFGHILAHAKQYYLRHFLSLVLRNAHKYWGKDTCKESLRLFNEERINLESTLREVAGGEGKVQNFQEIEDLVEACAQVAPYIDGCVPFKLSDQVFHGLRQFSESSENVTKQVEILCLLYDASRRRGEDMDKARNLIHQAIKLHDSNLPFFEQNSFSEAFYLSHYGRYLSQELDRRDEAQSLLEKALSIIDHASKFDKGRVLSQMGYNAPLGKRDNDTRNNEALRYFQEALDFRQCHYGEHVVTALAHKDVAGIYLSTEDFVKAEEHYEAAVRIFECTGMIKQKEVIPTYKNFARCCEKSGKIKEARAKFEMGIELADTTIEGNHKWKVEINTNLALILYKHYGDENRRAEEISKDVFQMAKELKMKTWFQSEELKTFYKKKDSRS